MAESERRVVVAGAGNAALCAALSARESGARVVVLERAPREARGGNSHFTDAAIRFAYDGIDEVGEVVGTIRPPADEGHADQVPEEEDRLRNGGEGEEAPVDVGRYPVDDFVADLERVTEGETDPDLARHLAGSSLPTMKWLRAQGVSFRLLFERQAYRVEGRWRFWGGLIVQAEGGGPGLMDRLFHRAEEMGVEVRYGCRAVGLLQDEGGRVRGVRVRTEGEGTGELAADAVVLACGGFESDSEWRARYLGPGWDLARVRGTRYNTGDGIRMAVEAGAQPWGHWSGCHAVAADAEAPRFGIRDPEASSPTAPADPFKRHSYPLGIVVNRHGRRFVDEGADFRNYTYAAYGAAILEQPGRKAWQIFDGRVRELLREEYRLEVATRIEAGSPEELARRLQEREGVDQEGFLRTLRAFNSAVQAGDFDPNVLDGKRTDGIEPPKSNWALPLDAAPFLAFPVTCAVTFTFGGVRVDSRARVLTTAGDPVPGLFAAGEMVGGLFYHNYPGGAGLMSGAVFGRTAGREAAGSLLK